MSHRTHLLAFVSAIALSGAAFATDAPGAMPATPSPMADVKPIDTKMFVPMAAQSDMFEIKAAELAISRSKTADIKEFATEMKKAHTETTAKMVPLAKSAGVEPPAKMDAEHEAMLKTLTDAKDADFDKAYVDGQVAAHEKAVSLFTTYASSGDNDQLIAFAKETAPVIQKHLDHAKMLQASMVGTGKMQ